MLRTLKPLLKYTVRATDDNLGRVHDFFFHDDDWTIRYLVVDVGHFLPGRKVLVPTSVLGAPDWATHTFPVDLSREQIEKSPVIDIDQPVSRQYEIALHQHFGRPFYWPDAGVGAWTGPAPLSPAPPSAAGAESTPVEKHDAHLRSVREVTGYHAHASDGELGRVKEFIADDEKWPVRYLVVTLSNWLPSKRVLLSPEWCRQISYVRGTVEVAMTREKVIQCPEFRATAAINREYEERLYDYYGRPVYWSGHRSGHKN